MAATWSVVTLPDGTSRLAVEGEIDLVDESPLVEQVDRLAATGSVHLDLAAVEFIDSSGVRALIRVHQAHGHRVQLVAVSPPVQRVLQIAGLSVLLGMVADGDGEEASS